MHVKIVCLQAEAINAGNYVTNVGVFKWNVVGKGEERHFRFRKP